MVFTDHWKVFVVGYRQFLLLNFSVMGNMDFFSQKVDAKMFTSPFWAFHYIPGPEKYGLLCSGRCICNQLKLIISKLWGIVHPHKLLTPKYIKCDHHLFLSESLIYLLLSLADQWIKLHIYPLIPFSTIISRYQLIDIFLLWCFLRLLTMLILLISW